MNVNNEQIAEQVLAAVGGKDNIEFVTHCMTRLRFNLKDVSIPEEEAVKKIQGVLGVVVSGGQYQVIIGQNVPKVYAALCAKAGIKQQEAVKENLDAPKEKLTPKRVGSNIMNYLAGSITPLLPILLAAGMFKTVLVIFGPDMLNLFSAKSNFYTVLNFLYNAGFYFLPIYLGYHAAKKIGASPVLGMYLGGILIAPAFVALAGTDISFDVFGIPCQVNNYSQSVLPILLAVAALFYVERLFKKIIPDALATIFVPFLTIFVMTPITLCLLAPLGSILSQYLSVALMAIATYGGFLGKAVIAAVWEFLVMTGMHTVLVLPAMTTLMNDGYEPLIFVCGKCATFATIGMSVGAFLRLKNKSEKAMTFGYCISGILGGVTEPILYGIGLRYKRPFLGMIVGGLAGGAYAGLMNVGVYTMSPSNILSFMGFVGDSQANLINGIISIAIALIVSAVVTYFFGFKKEDLEAKDET